MAIVLLIFILLILILVVIFAIQNSALVPISYLMWNAEISLALLLLLALICGVFIGLLVTLPSHYKNRRRISKRNKEIDELEATVHEQAAQLEMIEAQLAEGSELEEGLTEEPAVEAEVPVEEIEVEAEIPEPLDEAPVSEMEAEAQGGEADQPDETHPLEVEDAAAAEAGDEDQINS